MKIRVYRSDGVSKGGLFKTSAFNDGNCRVWYGPPHPHYLEQLIDISGHGNPSTEYSWFILQFSRDPDITKGSEEEDDFDGASQAIRVTPVEAARWFDRGVYSAPTDLLELARGYDPSSFDWRSEQEYEPLSEALQEVWGLLEHRSITGKQIAIELLHDPSQEDSIRKRISDIRKTGRTIDNRRGEGYFRPDAPPKGMGDSG
jgi:biotin operon repressor